MNVLIELGFELLELKEALAASTTGEARNVPVATQVCWNIAFRSDLVEKKNRTTHGCDCQLECISSCLKKKDTFVRLATSGGKSLIYQVRRVSSE